MEESNRLEGFDPKRTEPDFVFEEFHCPWCYHRLRASKSLEEGITSHNPGDVSVCYYCMGVIIIDLCEPRKPTRKEWKEIRECSVLMTQIHRIQDAITRAKKGRK